MPKKKKKSVLGHTAPINLNRILKEDEGNITINQVKPIGEDKIEWVSTYEMARRLFDKGFTGWGKDRLQMHAFRFGFMRWVPNKAQRAKVRRGRGHVTLNYRGMMNYIEFLSGLDSNFIPLPIPMDNHVLFSLMQFCLRYKLKVYMVYGAPAVSVSDWLMVVNYLIATNHTEAIEIEEPVHWQDIYLHHAKALEYKAFYAITDDYIIKRDPSKASNLMRALMSDESNEWRYASCELPSIDEAMHTLTITTKHHGEQHLVRVAMRAACGGDLYAPVGSVGWYCMESGRFLRKFGPNMGLRLCPVEAEQWKYAPAPKLTHRRGVKYNKTAAYTTTALNPNLVTISRANN